MAKHTIDFTDQADEVMAEIAKELGTTKAEVIRDALSMYWWAFREHGKGSLLLAQRGNKVTEQVFPRLDDYRERKRREGSLSTENR